MAVHCDPDVLHAPGECVYCDEYGQIEQKERVKNNTNFTGHHDTDKIMCPSEARRPLDSINKWPRNRATTQQDIKARDEALQKMMEEVKREIVERPLAYQLNDGGYATPSVSVDKLESKFLTTDPTDPDLGHGSNDAPVPQNKKYLVLSEDERNKDFVRPYRDSYKHDICGKITTMGSALSETYARDPKFYSATYCVHCSMHRPVNEFRWTSDNKRVGS